MSNPEIQIQKFYAQNPETQAFLLEVALNRYEDIFNEWDPAPFKVRDIDPDLKAYLEGCSNDIQQGKQIELVFSLPKGGKDPEKEQRVREGLQNYFAYESNLAARVRGQSARREVFTAVAAVILLMLMVQVNRYELAGFGLKVLREGLTIGAWVFSWEFILSFFFRKSEIIGRKKRWQRFSRAKIRFCQDDNAGGNANRD